MNYKPLTLPSLSWNRKVSSDTFGELVVQPLEPGFGITLGNALRRAILASVEGAAVTSVIIKGVNNEFSTIKGVHEDTLNVLLNIKGLIVKNKTGQSGRMYLQLKGEGVATAGSITADEHLEVLNKNHVIATMGRDAELEIEFFVDTGRGYQVAQWPFGKSVQADNRIYIDAMFSPIKRVEYSIEKTRVGQEIDFDKLTMRIYTNGAINPQDVVHYATSVLRSQFEHFLEAKEIPFNEISAVPGTEQEFVAKVDTEGPTRGLPVDLFLKPIDELEFSVRAHNCLIGAGIRRVIDLVNLTDEDVLKIKNFGRKSLREVKEILSAFSLHLGMNVKELDLKKAIKEQEGKNKS